MLKNINATGIKMRNGDYYWGEASHDYDNYYTPQGTGIRVNPDTSYMMAEKYSGSNNEGQFMLRGKDYSEESYLTFIKNGKIYGPYFRFIYEKYAIFSSVNENCQYDGFFINVEYNGNYLIYHYRNGTPSNKGVRFYNGYLYFVTLDSNLNVQNYLSKIYVGNQFSFTPCRLFMMPFNKDKKVDRTLLSHNAGCVCDVQVIGDEPNGYGICRWDDGDAYFGEYFAGYRSGMGCYRFRNGNLGFGKFYGGKMYGTMCIWYNDGGISWGNYTKGEKDGLFFDTYSSNPLLQISVRKGHDQQGLSYYINPDDFRISVVNTAGKIVETHYFG